MAGIKSHPPTKQVLQKILNRVAERNLIISNLFEFSAKTGVSYSDCIKIRFDQVIFENEILPEIEIVPVRSYHKRMATGKITPLEAQEDSAVLVSIDEDVSDVIKDCRALLSVDSELLFSQIKKTDKSYSIQYANSILKKVAHELNLDFSLTTNSFRQYFAEQLLDECLSEKEMSMRLGHDRQATTRHYFKTFLDPDHPFFKKDN